MAENLNSIKKQLDKESKERKKDIKDNKDIKDIKTFLSKRNFLNNLTSIFYFQKRIFQIYVLKN